MEMHYLWHRCLLRTRYGFATKGGSLGEALSCPGNNNIVKCSAKLKSSEGPALFDALCGLVLENSQMLVQMGQMAVKRKAAKNIPGAIRRVN